jgi:hypothetical protein
MFASPVVVSGVFPLIAFACASRLHGEGQRAGSCFCFWCLPLPPPPPALHSLIWYRRCQPKHSWVNQTFLDTYFPPPPSHPPWFVYPNNSIFVEGHKLWSSSLCSFLQVHVTSSLSGINVPLSIRFSNTVNLCCSLNVRIQLSHPHKKQEEL